MGKAVYTLEEVAVILRVNPRTIFRLLHGQNVKGIKLPATKVGRSWRISERDLKTFLTENANMREAFNQREFRDYIKTPKQKKK